MEAVLNGPSGQTQLQATTVTIGRTQDNALVVSDSKVSSHHAEIRPVEQGFTITDLGSTNGTFVNEQQIERNVPRFLAAGDMIRFGSTVFTYQVLNPPGIARPAFNAGQGTAPGYQPTIPAQPPPATAYGYGQSQDYPPAPPPPAYQPYGAAPQQPYMPQQQIYPPAPPTFSPYAPQPQYAPPAPTPPARGRGGRTLLLIILAVVIILAGTGLFFVIKTNQTNSANVAATSTAVANVTATFVANPYPPHTGTVALFDPLTDNTKGYKWDDGPNPSNTSNCQFTGGAYHVSNNRDHTFYYCAANANTYSNFTLQVQMTMIKGDCGGVVFRTDTNAHKVYFFEVCQNGTYDLVIYSGNAGRFLLQNTMNAAIKGGLNQSNLVAVVAQGSSIQLYVNNTMVGSTTDSSFSQGQIGLLVDEYNNPSEVSYTNVKLWTL